MQARGLGGAWAAGRVRAWGPPMTGREMAFLSRGDGLRPGAPCPHSVAAVRVNWKGIEAAVLLGLAHRRSRQEVELALKGKEMSPTVPLPLRCQCG